MIMTNDERYRYEERAAICEYEGGLTREEAERIAAEEIEEDRKTGSI
jgi:hypothetical protein